MAKTFVGCSHSNAAVVPIRPGMLRDSAKYNASMIPVPEWETSHPNREYAMFAGSVAANVAPTHPVVEL